jgi:NADP-dependent 3-hydroxy acid dehydrogenase YdfG
MANVAVITGAGAGIGRALAQRMAREGSALALADIDEAGLLETAAQISGVKVTTHHLDVADKAQFGEFANAVVATHGGAKYVFNNAGVGLLGQVAELSIEDYEWLMGVNFWGVVYGVKFFLPHLLAQPRAHIVNISSVFGIFAPAGQSAYCASKFAVRGFTEALRHELAGTPVKVTCVYPGGIRTDIARRSRVGQNAPAADKPAAVAHFDKVARTTPEQAAEQIVRAALRGRPRVLVGWDSFAIDKVVRLLPIKHWPLFKPQLEFKK